MIRAIYRNPTANILLNGEKLKAVPQRRGPVQGHLLLPLLPDTEPETRAHVTRQEKEMKGIQIRKKDTAVFV